MCREDKKKECAPHNRSPPPPTPYASPSPPLRPFTPTSLHFTLGFLSTSTLIFSHRTYLSIALALALPLSASYLALPTLYAETSYAEVSARIVTAMAHGCFHAALPFTAYEKLIRGAWRAGGCTCRKCAGPTPRILEFALRDDVKDAVLEREPARARGVVRDGVVHAGVLRLETTIGRLVCGHPVGRQCLMRMF
ncbi:hypothetical protein R3P38DRAFT_3127551, partial [Favolaschia claudopus]